MRARQKGQQFPASELEDLLIAFGDTPPSLPATIACLDEIVTDFIIEMCHQAALCAAYSHRAKIKLDDFKFALRKDPRKLGRVVELMAKEKDIKRQRRMVDTDEGELVKKGAEEVEGRSSKKRKVHAAFWFREVLYQIGLGRSCKASGSVLGEVASAGHACI
ncbi:hypothetical protein FH972_025938 [Carpinus fangiana]|uniref:Transcription initiation factor TFIID subunit 13 n=1 Tax=Carpinus fangiana TaxID=176857 RepID=A0A5N6L2V4_9ROSI|nr:hypothetical protein FH972_025938 [Carpinus fangiana]